MYDLLQNCSEKAVSENKTVQDLTSKLDQKATASSEGLSLMFLALIAAAIIGLPVIGGSLLGVVFLKILFPVFIAVGIVLISLYFYTSKEEMRMVGFSTFVKDNPVCDPTPLASGGVYPNSEKAAISCGENPDCLAFDWKGLDISPVGIGTLVTPPTTTFYSRVSAECRSNIGPDNVRLLASPNASDGTGLPRGDGGIGDMYLDKLTSQWYQQTSTGWKPMGVISHDPFVAISWGGDAPETLATPQDGELYVYFNKANPVYFHVFRYDRSHGWLEERKIRGPGLIPATPSIINASGFKETHRYNTWMLYAGIACVVIGLGGTLYTALLKKEEYEGCNSFPFSFKRK
jgi:hypothetical protein